MERSSPYTTGTGRVFLDRIRSFGHPWLRDRTVGIYTQVSGGVPVMHGSGVLLRIADAAFILSAGHVLKAGKERDTMLLISQGTPSSGFLELSGADMFHTHDMEDVDIGFALLSPAHELELVGHKRFLRLDDLELSQTSPAPGWYSILGYPRMLGHTDLVARATTANPLYFATNLYGDPLDNFSTGISIALALSPSHVVDADGDRSRLPDLHGVSGCGIWRMHRAADPFFPEKWTPSSIRLVGIEHSVVPFKAIKGVLVPHVIGCIARAFPALRPSIEIVLNATLGRADA